MADRAVKYPTPTRSDHQKFCENEGWRQVRNARGGAGSHHITYELTLPDGRVLRTRVSHPPDRTAYGPSLLGHILKDQLDVDEATFWACVRGGARPDRGAAARPEGSGLPARLVFQLLEAGLDQEDIAQMSKADALAALAEYWSRPRIP